MLLSLLQQLAYDISKDTAFKLAWIDDVVAAIDPTDQNIVAHGSPIYDEVLKTLSVESNDKRTTKNTMQHLHKYSRISHLHGSKMNH